MDFTLPVDQRPNGKGYFTAVRKVYGNKKKIRHTPEKGGNLCRHKPHFIAIFRRKDNNFLQARVFFSFCSTDRSRECFLLAFPAYHEEMVFMRIFFRTCLCSGLSCCFLVSAWRLAADGELPGRHPGLFPGLWAEG